jgi:hypothetical protein
LCLTLIVFTMPSVRGADAPYLPDDAEIVVGVEVKPLLDSPTGKQLLPALVRATGRLFSGTVGKEYEQGVDGFLKLLGADDAKQRSAFQETFRRVLIAGPFTTTGEAGFLWTVEGKFDAGKFGEVVELVAGKRPLGVSVEPKKPAAREICALRLRGGDVIYFALADESIYLSGAEKRVKDALKGDNGNSSKARAELRKRVAAPDHPPVWAVGVFGNDENLEKFDGNLTLENGLRLELRATAKSTEIAKRFKDQLLEKQADWRKSPPPRDGYAALGLELLKRFTVGRAVADLTLQAELSTQELKNFFPD